jgi:hypothetical protein
MVENNWHTYESEKKKIAEIAQSADEYQRMINELCDRLGI